MALHGKSFSKEVTESFMNKVSFKEYSKDFFSAALLELFEYLNSGIMIPLNCFDTMI